MRLQTGKTYKTLRDKLVRVDYIEGTKGIRFKGSDGSTYNYFGHRIFPEGDQFDALMIELSNDQMHPMPEKEIVLKLAIGETTLQDVKTYVAESNTGITGCPNGDIITALIEKIEELQNDVVWLVNNFTKPYCIETRERLEKISASIPDKYRTIENGHVIHGGQAFFPPK